MKQNKFYQIKNVTEDKYTLVGCDGIVTTRPIQEVYKSASAFTIQDAKDGDVLSFYSEYKGNKMVQVGIIEKYVGKHGGCSNTFKIYFGVNWENNLQIGEYMGCSDIRPATKEQRDTLMKAMADAGYTFYFEKKELEKIEQNPTVWSEEDKDIRNTIIRDLKRLGGDIVNVKPAYKEEVGWLKSLERRIGWKPTKEQMKALHDLNLTGNISYAGQGQVLIELYNDLLKLKA